MLRRSIVGFISAFALASACTGPGGEEGGICYADREAAKPPLTTSVMDVWGSACTTDQECVARLGAGAICGNSAIIFELPGGYCSKPCMIGDDPMDTSITVELDDPECDPAGGVACVGANGIYSRCAVACLGDEQCGRSGYFCRTMPQIAADTDPTFCLMDDCCEDACE